LTRLILDEVLEGIRDGTQRITTSNFDGRLASIDLTLAGMQQVCETFKGTGMEAKMTEALVAQLGVASANGDGDKDISRLIETIWSRRRSRVIP
jgi:hypothetical protein